VLQLIKRFLNRNKPSESNEERLEYLFELYEEMVKDEGS